MGGEARNIRAERLMALRPRASRRDQVEKRRLAGAVRTDDEAPLAGVRANYAVDGGSPPKDFFRPEMASAAVMIAVASIGVTSAARPARSVRHEDHDAQK